MVRPKAGDIVEIKHYKGKFKLEKMRIGYFGKPYDTYDFIAYAYDDIAESNEGGGLVSLAVNISDIKSKSRKVKVLW